MSICIALQAVSIYERMYEQVDVSEWVGLFMGWIVGPYSIGLVLSEVTAGIKV